MACHRSLWGQRKSDESPGLLLCWSSLFLAFFFLTFFMSLFFLINSFWPPFLSLFLFNSCAFLTVSGRAVNLDSQMKQIIVSTQNRRCHGIVVNSASFAPDNLPVVLVFSISVQTCSRKSAWQMKSKETEHTDYSTAVEVYLQRNDQVMRWKHLVSVNIGPWSTVHVLIMPIKKFEMKMSTMNCNIP